MKKLNKIFIPVFFLAISSLSFASENITESLSEGIKVIVKKTPKDVISAKIFFLGGTANYDKETEGIEALALELMSESGTQNLSKEEFHGQMEKIGASIGVHSNYDYTTVNLTCLKQYWDQSWALFSDAINNPLMDEGEFNRLKEQMVSGIEQRESDPDSHLRVITMQNAFKGFNYEKTPEGSLAAMENITYEKVKSYYANLLAKNKMIIVVVGNLDAAEVNAKVAASFGAIQKEGIEETQDLDWSVGDFAYHEEQRDIATNYIRGYMTAPAVGTKDEVALQTAMRILRDRYFQELRTKRSLTYAPGAFYPSGILKSPYLALYVSTDKPNEAVRVMKDELKKIHNEGFTEEELNNKKGTMLTNHYQGQETSANQAETLGKAEITGGWEQSTTFMDDVYNLTIDELNAAFKKYTKHISWTYLGDTSIVDKEVFLSPIASEN